MTATPMLTYRISTALDDDATDQLFDRLTEVGLGGCCGVMQESRWELMFDFSCGCPECAQPETVEQAREIVEAALRAEGLEFELTEVEMIDDD